ALIRLRVLHPFLAVATTAYLVVLGFRLRSDRQAAPLARPLAALALTQTALGALNVVLLAPVWMQVAHLLLADLVWIVLVLLAAQALGSEAPSAVRSVDAPGPRHAVS